MERLSLLLLVVCFAACGGPVLPDAGGLDAGGLDASRDAGGPPGSDGGPDAGTSCVPDCTGRECGPDPRCGASCGECAEPAICNEEHGRCLAIDLTCPASGAPFTEFRDEALGIATNELHDGRYDSRARAALLGQAGVSFGQLGIVWDAAGSVDYASRDELFAELRDAGMRMVVLLSSADWSTVTAADWTARVREAVLRYGPAGLGLVSDWQLGNEPNLPMNGLAVERYVELLAATYEGVHSADPSARVWGPSVVFHYLNDGYGDGSAWPGSVDTSAPMAYLDGVLDAAATLDVVSVHIYEPSPRRMLDVQLAIVEHMAARGLRGIPLVVNEGNFGNQPSRTPPGTCPYSAATDLVLADDVARFYACLFAANAAQALWFNADDRYTPGAPCGEPNIRRTGVLGFAADPSASFEPARVKDAWWVLRRIAREIEGHRLARARIEAVPSPCRLDTSGGCATTLVWTRRDPSLGAVQVRRDGEIVGCVMGSDDIGSAEVRVSADHSRFDLVQAADCTSEPSSPDVLDTVFVRGEAMAPSARAAVFALDDPCAMPDATTGCASAIGVWTEGIDASRWPNVRLYAGANSFQCIAANTTATFRTGPWQSERGVLYRLYESAGCAVGAPLGRLIAATRAHGAPP